MRLLALLLLNDKKLSSNKLFVASSSGEDFEIERNKTNERKNECAHVQLRAFYHISSSGKHQEIFTVTFQCIPLQLLGLADYETQNCRSQSGGFRVKSHFNGDCKLELALGGQPELIMLLGRR